MRLLARLLLGLAAGIVGLLPWLVHGMRLPLQNLWAAPVMAATSPVVLLPFSQYAVLLLAALLVAGGAVAGLAARALPGGRPCRERLLLLLGVLVVQVVAIAQTAGVVGDGLQSGPASAVYLGLLVAGCAFSALVGVAVLLLITARARAAAVVGAAITAPLVSSWVGALASPPVAPWSGPDIVLAVLPWLTAVVVGLAVGWGGVGTTGRIAAAVFGAASLWVGDALVTAVASAASMRVYARYPAELLDYAAQVFRSALVAVDLVLPRLLLAAVIAAVVIGVRALLARRRVPQEG